MVKLNVILPAPGTRARRGLATDRGGRRATRASLRWATSRNELRDRPRDPRRAQFERCADLAIEPALTRVQNDLFDLAPTFAFQGRRTKRRGRCCASASQVKALEDAIDVLDARLHPLRSFVLPGGTPAAAALHQARAVCRRAERSMVALAEIQGEEVGEASLAYVDGLSDYLFVAARAANDFGKIGRIVGARRQSERRRERERPSDEWLRAAHPAITPQGRGVRPRSASSAARRWTIDVALIESDGGAQLKTGPAATFPYSPAVAERLRAVVADLSEAQAPQLELERLVTDAHVAAVEAFLDEFGRPRARRSRGPARPDHPASAARGLTRQLCDGERAAAALKIDVVSDFRSADVAAGGEGAPLAPIYHAAMAAGLERPLMILNWGGVGNVTYLGPEGEIIAFDTGPANALLDDFLIVRRGLAYDENGALGESGRVDAEALATLMSDPYFDRPAPKSLDRNHFSAAAACVKRLSDADGAATLSAFTVESTAAALKHVPQRRRAGWSAAAGGGTRTSCAGLPTAASQGRAGRGDRLRRRQHRGAMFRLSRLTFAARPADLLSDHDRRSDPMTGGVFWPAGK